VSVFTSKVDLGTGTGTSLDRSSPRSSMFPCSGSEWKSATRQGASIRDAVGSRTLERAGPQLRQAAAAARTGTAERASVQLGAPVNQLTVTDGVVSASAIP